VPFISYLLTFTKKMETLTSSLIVYPRQELCNVDVHAGVVRLGAAVTPADYAVLPPMLVLLADQWTAAITATRVLAALHVAGTQHVLGQRDAEVVVESLAFVPVDYWHHDLTQHVVVSGVYNSGVTMG